MLETKELTQLVDDLHLDEGANFAVFNSSDFFIWKEGTLHSLLGTGKLTPNVDIEDLKTAAKRPALTIHDTVVVVEFYSLDELLDFFNRESWKYTTNIKK